MSNLANPSSLWELLPPEIVVQIGHQLPVKDRFSLGRVNRHCRSLSCLILRPQTLRGVYRAQFVLRCIRAGDLEPLAGDLDATDFVEYIIGCSNAARGDMCRSLICDMDVWLDNCYHDKQTAQTLCCVLAQLEKDVIGFETFAPRLGDWLYKIKVPGGVVNAIGRDGRPCPLFVADIQCAYLECCIRHRDHDEQRALLDPTGGFVTTGPAVLETGVKLAWHYRDQVAHNICVQFFLSHKPHCCAPLCWVERNHLCGPFFWNLLSKYIAAGAWEFIGALRSIPMTWAPCTSAGFTAGCLNNVFGALLRPSVIEVLVKHPEATTVVCNLIAGAGAVLAIDRFCVIDAIVWPMLECSLANRKSYGDTVFSDMANHPFLECVSRHRELAALHDSDDDAAEALEQWMDANKKRRCCLSQGL